MGPDSITTPILGTACHPSLKQPSPCLLPDPVEESKDSRPLIKKYIIHRIYLLDTVSPPPSLRMSCPNTFSSTPTREQLLAVTNRYLTAFANNKTHPLSMLTFFSTTSPVYIQHYPSNSPHPQASIIRGPNAVRSYFDLIATHWTRSPVAHRIVNVDPYMRTIVFEGSVTWKWKKSGRSWVEDFTCTLAFDEQLKIVSYVVRTDSASQTCLMRAKDVDDSSFAKIFNANTSSVQIVTLEFTA
ncbi:hypothetical protein C0993_007234 [Termitomyces sp. T159_Od127]|nr:hypothetical protein C0993_007234 [Termitomyces sp. T159_Od127]